MRVPGLDLAGLCAIVSPSNSKVDEAILFLFCSCSFLLAAAESMERQNGEPTAR